MTYKSDRIIKFIQEGHIEDAFSLMQSSPAETTLAMISAASHGYSEVLSVLLSHPLENDQNNRYTSLHAALNAGRVECVRILIPETDTEDLKNRLSGSEQGTLLRIMEEEFIMKKSLEKSISKGKSSPSI